MPQIGRQGYLGFALQTDFNTPNTTPSAFLPFNSFTLQPKHTPIAIQHSVASRVSDVSSVEGQKSSEGDLEVNLDVINFGYPMKLFMGNEVLSTGTPNRHTLYTTISGNTPLHATIIRNYGSTDVEQINSVVANTFEISVSDELVSAKFGLMGRFPTTGTAQTPTTLSGTVFSFSRYQVQLGATVALAAASTPITVEEFSLSGNNNIIPIYSSRSADGTNSNNVRLFRLGKLELSGKFKIFFDSVTQRDNYKNLVKQAMVVKFSEGSLESVTINIPKVRYQEEDIDTQLDDLYALNIDFVAELDRTQGIDLFNVVILNSKSTVY